MLLLARDDPSLCCRSAANSNERPPPAMTAGQKTPRSLRNCAFGAPAEEVRHVAQGTMRIVGESARHAEEAARLAEEAARAARRGTLAAAGFGTLAAIFGLVIVTAGQINRHTTAEAVQVNAALVKLGDTQQNIDRHLTALHAREASPAALITPSGTLAAPLQAETVPAALPSIAPAGRVAIKPLPPVTWSIPRHPTPGADADATPSMAMTDSPGRAPG